jgi:hypothetical protein
MKLIMQLCPCSCSFSSMRSRYSPQHLFKHLQSVLLPESERPSFTPKATDWTIGVVGIDSRQGLGNFLFTTASRTDLRLTGGALSLGVKRPGREADHSPASSAEVKE